MVAEDSVDDINLLNEVTNLLRVQVDVGCLMISFLGSKWIQGTTVKITAERDVVEAGSFNFNDVLSL